MQKNYFYKFQVGAPGALEGVGQPRVIQPGNKGANLYASSTITIPATVDANYAYWVTVNGVTATFTTDSTPTTTELRNGLITAIRASSIINNFDLDSIQAASFRLRSRRAGVQMTVAVSTSSTNDLAFSVPTVAAFPEPIPFGVVVGRAASDPPDAAKRPAATSDILLGVTMSTYAEQRSTIGPNAQTEYPPLARMDVLQDNLSTEGIWVRFVSPVTETTTPLYAVVGGAQAGWVTTVATGNLALQSRLVLLEPTVNSEGGLIGLCRARF